MFRKQMSFSKINIVVNERFAFYMFLAYGGTQNSRYNSRKALIGHFKLVLHFG